jgi:hypothetical protein
MPKRTHKQSKHELEKIARAQHRNQFFKRLESICELVGGKNVYNLIPTSVLERIYNIRLQAPKIIAASNEKVDDSTVKYAILLYASVLKKEKTQITRKNHAITMYDYYTVGLTFMLYLLAAKDNEFPKIDELRYKMVDLMAFPESFEIANEHMRKINLAFGNIHSDLNKQMFWLEHNIVKSTDDKNTQQNLIVIHTAFPEHKQITIDGITRPITVAGWCFPNFGFDKITLTPSELGVESTFSALPLEVFIQNHAFIRLRERLDNIMIGFVHYSMFLSLKFPKVIRDKKGSILVEFDFFGTKAGYLVVEIIQGIILVRTFLFLTHNGTPEGDKLEEICGLGKLDKKYLAIDKLSAFMVSGIGQNEELNQIFKKAGCEGLLHLYEKFNIMSEKDTQQATSDLLVKFLGLDKSQAEHKQKTGDNNEIKIIPN